MHADEERIAQEFLLKKLQSVYLDYINPYSTRVLMLYKGQRFGIGVIQNNIAMNYNHPELKQDRNENKHHNIARRMVKRG